MKVQSFPQHNIARSLKNPGENQPPTPEQPTPPPQDSVESGGGRQFLAGAGGALAGTAAGIASGAATFLVANQLGRVLNATMPAVASVAPGTTGILLTAAGASILGAGVAVLAGTCVGAKVAAGAARGDVKPDITQSGHEQKGVGKFQQYSAELRENVQGVGTAKSYKGAFGAGFRAGAAIGGPAGAAAGKIQGALVGAALGGFAAVPLMGLISHPAVLIPGAIAGALLGHKIGEPVGHAVGSLTLGTVSGLGGLVCHAVAGDKPDQA